MDKSRTNQTGPRTSVDDPLAAFFEAARAEAPEPTGDFMARLTAEALAEMPVARPRQALDTPSLWAQLRQALGGWAGVAGLAAACAAGVWVGVNPPTGLEGVWPGVLSATDALSVDPLSGFDLALLEG